MLFFLIEISKLLGLTKHISIAFYALLISFTFVQHQAIHDCTSSMLAACYHSSQKEAACGKKVLSNLAIA